MADMQAPCPMCRERKLHLMPTGLIRCLNRACPRPSAAQEILDGDVGADIVQIDVFSFSMIHPLRERLDGGLFGCPVARHLEALNSPPAAPGRYRAKIGDDGTLDLAVMEEAGQESR